MPHSKPEYSSLSPREIQEIKRVREQTKAYIVECKEFGFNMRAECLENLLENTSDAALNAFIAIAKGFF